MVEIASGRAVSVACRDLRKSFGDTEVLRGVTLSLREGEIAAVVGPSGSGKSTLLHLVGLMEPPTGGDLSVFSRRRSEITEEAACRLRLEAIGFMFQFHHLLPELSVMENVLVPCRLAGDRLEEGRDRAREILERLGLQGRGDRRPHELSGGEQQRAALARALVRRPRLLLCDEPTGNLDRPRALDVQALLWAEARRTGATVLVATHNELLAAEAGRVFEIKDGQTIEKHP